MFNRVTLALHKAAWFPQQIAEAQLPESLPYGYWVAPTGEHHDVAAPGDHMKWAKKHQKSVGIKPDNTQYDIENRWRVPLLRKNYVRVASRGSEMAVQAMKFTPAAARKVKAMIGVHLQNGGTGVTIDRFDPAAGTHTERIEAHHTPIEIATRLRRVLR